MWSSSSSDDEEYMLPGYLRPTASDTKRQKLSEAQDDQRTSSSEPQAGPSSAAQDVVNDVVSAVVDATESPPTSPLLVGGQSAINSSADLAGAYNNLTENFNESLASGSRESVNESLGQQVRESANLLQRMKLGARDKDHGDGGNNPINPSDLLVTLKHTSLMASLFKKNLEEKAKTEADNDSAFKSKELVDSLKQKYVSESGDFSPSLAAENIAIEAAGSSRTAPGLITLRGTVGRDQEGTNKRKQPKQPQSRNTTADIVPPVANPEGREEDAPGHGENSRDQVLNFVRREYLARGDQGIPILDVVRAGSQYDVMQRLFNVAELVSQGKLCFTEDNASHYTISPVYENANEAEPSAGPSRNHKIMSWSSSFLRQLAQAWTQENRAASAPPENAGDVPDLSPPDAGERNSLGGPEDRDEDGSFGGPMLEAVNRSPAYLLENNDNVNLSAPSLDSATRFLEYPSGGEENLLFEGLETIATVDSLAVTENDIPMGSSEVGESDPSLYTNLENVASADTSEDGGNVSSADTNEDTEK